MGRAGARAGGWNESIQDGRMMKGLTQSMPTAFRRPLLVLVFFLGFGTAFAQETLQVSLSPSVPIYSVNQVVTVSLKAFNGGVPDPTFNQSVTIGLYSNASIGSP